MRNQQWTPKSIYKRNCRANSGQKNEIGLPRGGGVEYLHRSPASLESETIKYGLQSDGTGDQKMTALAGASKCKRQIRPFVRERPKLTNPNLSDSYKNLVVSPRWLLYSKTDWPTDRQ
jgi:hypothetical protein